MKMSTKTRKTKPFAKKIATSRYVERKYFSQVEDVAANIHGGTSKNSDLRTFVRI